MWKCVTHCALEKEWLGGQAYKPLYLRTPKLKKDRLNED